MKNPKPKFMLPSPNSALTKMKKVKKILLGVSMFIKPEDIFKEKTYMSDEELYYVASSIKEMETIRQQRALFDVMHFQCDDDSIQRFMAFFSDDVKRQIMYSC